MLIRESIADYQHLDFGSIKLAFTQVCKDELFRDVYFAANSLYYVESGEVVLYSAGEEICLKKGDVAFIRQHSKLDIRKFKDTSGADFKSIIFYLFPDFISEFLHQTKADRVQHEFPAHSIFSLGKHEELRDFSESLLAYFKKPQIDKQALKQKTFEALGYLSQHNKGFLSFLAENSKSVKIDLYEFMIHIAINNYSVTDLARLTGRSISAFKRDFKYIFDTTPHQWLLNGKIDYAEQLLREKRMRASDIYFMLGFQELSHFSMVFKKMKGFSPSQI